MNKPLRIGVIGAGWLGLPLVGHLSRAGRYRLLATTRREEKLAAISQAGATAVLLHLPIDKIEEEDNSAKGIASKLRPLAVSNQTGQPELKKLFSADVLIVTLPPGRSRLDTFNAYGAEINSLIDAARRFGCSRFIYTSSTGVYGQAKGRVDEQSPTIPTTESARAVLAAEQAFEASGIPTTILRLAGLYGPDRDPGRWFQKRPIKNADAPVNLVHQQDVIRAIQLVIEQNAWNKTYNVCGADHPTKGEYYKNAALALGLDPPTTEAGGQDGKWVDSSKIREQLGWASRN
ncbi:MAG: SDR family oxidoreductase [Bacteroidota bacterium]